MMGVTIGPDQEFDWRCWSDCGARGLRLGDKVASPLVSFAHSRRRVLRMTRSILFLLLACSDYELSEKSDALPGVDTASPADTVIDPDCDDFAPPVVDDPTAESECLADPGMGSFRSSTRTAPSFGRWRPKTTPAR